MRKTPRVAADVIADRLDAVVERQAQRPFLVRFGNPPLWHDIIDEAARRRGIAIDGYARRALMAFVTRDLGLEWTEVMADEPTVYDWDDFEAREQHGEGFGDWSAP